jgi:ATP-dependent DNA helicase 2 subunit 2
MNAYIDSMDLSSFGRDDEGYFPDFRGSRHLLTAISKPTEYMPIEDTYSPVLHRINQAIKRRAVRPEEPVQPPADILIRYSHSPEELVEKSEAKLSKLVAAANIKKGRYHPGCFPQLLIFV